MTNGLRWLVIATHVPPDGSGGGMVRYTTEIIRALHRDPRLELHVLVIPGGAALWSSMGLSRERVHVVPGLPTWLLSSAERSGLGLRAMRSHWDVVHGVKHLVPARTKGLRLLTVHDMLPLDRPADFNWAKRLLLRRPYLASIEDADCIVTVSKATLDRLTFHSPGVVDRARVVQLAASTALRSITPVGVPGLEGVRYALVVGDASPRKNLRTLMLAWHKLVSRGCAVRLVVVGPSGWGTDDNGGQVYQALVSTGDLVPLGYVDDAELAWCYRNAELVLCPSRLEGFGLPAVEAMAFGAPIITSDDPALCEVTGGMAPHVRADDVDAWVAAIEQQLGSGRRTAHSVTASIAHRTWDDVAAETIDAVLRA